MHLVNLSGGIDSANCTYNLLKEGKQLLVHHCIYENRMDRAEEEKQATDRIISWLQDQKLNKFNYIESSISVSNFRYCLYDIELMGVLSSGLFRIKKNNIDTIVICESLDDFEQHDFYIRNETRLSVIRALCEPFGKVDIVFPNEKKSREEVIRSTPPELLKLCSYCRSPKRCKLDRLCKTCVKTIPVLESMGLK